jgi:hypothetical protein
MWRSMADEQWLVFLLFNGVMELEYVGCAVGNDCTMCQRQPRRSGRCHTAVVRISALGW